MITSTMIGVMVAYAVGTVLGGVMVARAKRRTEVEIIEYTIDKMIENKFIKTRVNSDQQVVLCEYDSE